MRIATSAVMRRAPFGLTLVALLAATPVENANAETGVIPDVCFPLDVKVPSTVPANVPGLPIRGDYAMAGMTLLASDGTAVPLTIEPSLDDPTLAVARIAGSLEAGKAYTLSWDDRCAGPSSVTFSATAAVPLPTTAGVVAAAPPTELGSDAPCDATGRPKGDLWSTISFHPSAELIPFLELTEIDLIVDGTRRAVVHAAASGNVLGNLSVHCPWTTTKQRVTARARVPGMEAISTPSVEIVFQCPGAGPGACTNVDAGGSTTSGGCTLGRGASVPAVAALVLLALSQTRRRRA